MPYTSPAIGLRRVIDDANFASYVSDPVIGGEVKTRGKLPRDYLAQPFGSLPYAAEFDIPIIPRNEWIDRIEQQDKDGTSLCHICDQAGLTVLDQNGTNYCWINAPTHCLEIIRVVQNQPMVRLSPASCGAKIKNFRNVGGWGTEGLEYIVNHGSVPQSIWPANAISRQYDTAEADAERVKYRVQEWWELRPRNFEQLVTCLLLNIPVAIGLNWWSHEVTAMRALVSNGKVVVEIDNSWGTGWENNGRGLLSESKATPDDAVAPRVATPS